jgi:hypothetical protein
LHRLGSNYPALDLSELVQKSYAAEFTLATDQATASEPL